MSYNMKLENFFDLQTNEQNKSHKRAALSWIVQIVV